MGILEFFAFAHERHAIWEKRAAGLPQPWTGNPILHNYKFTNVYRELDATTVWFRENVRSVTTEPLLATVVFRWFNRIRTGEAIFLQLDLHGHSAFWNLLDTGNTDQLRDAIVSYCGPGPYVTGAYIIKTPEGMDKLSGVCECIRRFIVRRRAHPTEFWSLEHTWEWLRQFDHLGDFMAYEIVSDLRHTPLLRDAPDIMTWANPGPGAARGLGRVFAGDPTTWNQHTHKRLLIDKMRELLETSRHLWPLCWPQWEMREVEHTLCEFDKYERTRLREGRPRGLYHHV